MAAARYPLAAQRGLQLFIGRGNCQLCHGGPRFTHGEFADIGLRFFVRPGVVDAGRFGGIEALKASPYNLLSRWADPAPPGQPDEAVKTPHTVTLVSSRCPGCGRWRAPRRTCMTASLPRWRRWSGTTPS